MIIVKVTYTVRDAFAQENKENIRRFMKDFRALQDSRFRYTAYVAADGKTFVHHSVFRDEAIQQKVLNVPSFMEFQRQRDASVPDRLPEIEVLSLVDTSYDLLP